MLFAGSFLLLNIASILFGLVLSWYCGGANFYLHPDRFIGSIISYMEKWLFRDGTYKEGLYAMVFSLISVFLLSLVLLYFAGRAGWFWYFAFSSAMVYFSINEKHAIYERDPNAVLNFLNHALPVIFYSFLIGPAAAPAVRALPVMSAMMPEGGYHREFGRSAREFYSTVSGSANLLNPLILFLFAAFKEALKKLRRRFP
jgi:cobalamin biosynthesis protein CobD/CbiB